MPTVRSATLRNNACFKVKVVKCRTTLAALVAGVAISGAVAPSTALADYPPKPKPAPTPAKVAGKWAHPRMASKIYAKPSTSSRKKGRLHFLTEDGFPEVYKVFGTREVDEVVWVRIGIPARPNGQTGWVEEESLGEVRTTYRTLTIDRKRFVARLWENRKDGRRRLLWQSPVGVGAPGTETPRGNFWIRERIKGFQTGTIYGYMAFGTSAYSKLSDWPGGGVVGVHGTNEPWLIPGEISHGCVRVPNKKIYKLSKVLRIGTPVQIR